MSKSRNWIYRQRELDDRPVKNWLWEAFHEGRSVAIGARACAGKDPFTATVDNARSTLKHLQQYMNSNNLPIYHVVVRDEFRNSWAGYCIDVRESGPMSWHKPNGGQRKHRRNNDRMERKAI